MTGNRAKDLKELYDRKARALERRPVFARGTGQVRVSAADDIACEVEHAFSPLRVDLPADEGGGNTGPQPDHLMRAGIGAGLVMGYTVWAARLEIPIDGIHLELTCDFDARGQMAVAPEVPVGWQRLVVDVTITSPASEGDVRRVVDVANRHSPMLANLSPAVQQVHRLTVTKQQRTT